MIDLYGPRRLSFIPFDDDPRIYLPKAEFYITNVCNLSCDNCNRFNNHNFTGWQNWQDYQDIYVRWAEKIKIDQLVILGGEPLINPSICDWIRGLNRVWHRGVQIVTNGTRLNQVPGLYDALVQDGRDGGNWIAVSIHNANDTERYLDEIQKFLKSPIIELVGNDKMGADYAFKDRNGLHIHAWIQDSFYNASIQQKFDRFVLHDSDPDLAHAECGMVKYKNYHFVRGKLYKCGPVALMPEFDQQHTLAISDQDRVLLNSYTPLSIDNFDQQGENFIKNIDTVIPQCKFCPSSFENKKIFALNKNKNSTNSFKITHK